MGRSDSRAASAGPSLPPPRLALLLLLSLSCCVSGHGVEIDRFGAIVNSERPNFVQKESDKFEYITLESNRFGARAESGQLMDELPAAHRYRLELLTAVLALDEEWSPVWSEKLISEAVIMAADLDMTFCKSLGDIGEPMNTLDVIKRVNRHCSHSGMFVEFGVMALARSVSCLFYRHARVQLDVVLAKILDLKNLKEPSGKELASHLDRLLEDYQVIADKLATVGAKLTHLITLVMLLDGIRNTLFINDDPKTTVSKLKRNIKSKVGIMIRTLEKKTEKYCYVEATEWYDVDSDKMLSLDVNESDIEIEGNEPPSTPPAENVPTDPLLKNAHRLRLISRKVFDGLLLGKLSPAAWKLIFEKNILLKPIQAPQETVKSTSASKSVNLFNSITTMYG